jgi:GTP pyrophosphokinase
MSGAIPANTAPGTLAAATAALPRLALPEPLEAGLGEAERALVERAHAWAAVIYGDRVLGTGEPVLEHARGLAANIAALRLDADTLAAGLLFAVPTYAPDGEEQLAARFGPGIAALVGGITRLNALRVVTRNVAMESAAAKGARVVGKAAGIAAGKAAGKTVVKAAGKSAGGAPQVEILRKMLLAMVEDIRVVLLRLASRTQTLRFLARATQEDALAQRGPVARETLDIYAPLANRLGVWQLKWELEDLSLRFLEPDTYKAIARQLDERRAAREQMIEGSIDILRREVAAAGIRADISGRPKHIYSIWNKMRAKSLDFSQIYDVRGLRVLVDDVKDCYAVLGIVHNLWQPIPKEFDDYISRPKGNFYRSLHTAVIGPDDRAMEVQIRTHEMHRHAELGVAAHWRYKEGGGPSKKTAGGDPFDDRIAFLRQVLAWRDEVVDSADWVEQFKHAAVDETVYVLTPQGRVIDLSAGSTPVDFAYALHSELGHRCRGARVNDQLVPLDRVLKNGERVEIITVKTGGPSRDWLNPALGFIRSSRARNKVRQWFNNLALEQTVADGRAIVERALQREGRTGLKLEALADTLGFKSADELFAAVGREEVGSRQLQEGIRALSGEAAEAALPAGAGSEASPLARRGRADRQGTGVLVVGVDRLMTQLARCCRPVRPERITGYVTRGRGVSIHRAGCRSLARLIEKDPERAIDAEWGTTSGTSGGREDVYAVDIIVQTSERAGVLRDISEALARERINLTAVGTLSRKAPVTTALSVEVKDLAQLSRTLALLGEVPGVLSAARR